MALLLDASPDAVYGEDAEGLITTWNRSAERLFGRSGDQVIGEPSAGLYPRHRQDEIAFLARRVRAGEVVEGYEVDVERHDGAAVPVVLTACPVAAEGRTIGAWVSLRDVTEQKMAEVTLTEWAGRLEEAQALAHVGLWHWDPASGAMQMSNELHRICGLDPSQFDGTFDGLVGLFHAQDAVGVADAMRSAHAAARAFELEFRLLRPSGEVRWVYAHGEPVLDIAGATVGLRGIIQDITERKASEAALHAQAEQLSDQATHDSLTGLPNRTLFLNRLGEALRLSAENGDGLAVLFVDLDGFKLVNDSLGHAAGDSVLVALADRIRSVLRPTDTVARFGGDEFTMVCGRLAHEQDVTGIVERVNEVVSRPLQLEDGVEVAITTSIGIAFARGPEDRPEDLLRDADLAMYRAKEQGRSRAIVFDADMHTRAAERLETVSRLRGAADRGELRLFFQPQVSLEGGEVVGAEALIRWQHPERGLVPPNQFIPLAEESKLIAPIGKWVLEEACRQAVVWGGLKVAVNVSAYQLAQGDLVENVDAILRDTGLSPASLCLEITEGVLMGDTDGSLEVLRGLKDLGVAIAVDDFGMGYSSLAYLQRFPVDILKVDQAFVARLDSDAPHRTALVGAIVDLAHALGQTAVAEGVETTGQAADLRALGCDVAQGYLFGKPTPAGEWGPVFVTP